MEERLASRAKHIDSARKMIQKYVRESDQFFQC